MFVLRQHRLRFFFDRCLKTPGSESFIGSPSAVANDDDDDHSDDHGDDAASVSGRRVSLRFPAIGASATTTTATTTAAIGSHFFALFAK